MLYKDSCNRKSNQKNLGTIKSSNLCTEIIEYSSPEEVIRKESVKFGYYGGTTTANKIRTNRFQVFRILSCFEGGSMQSSVHRCEYVYKRGSNLQLWQVEGNLQNCDQKFK